MSDRAMRVQWFMTLNNFTQAELETLQALTPEEAPELVVDEEVGEEGTPHLHAYIHWAEKRRLSQMKTFLPRAHWEGVRSRPHTIDYVSKGKVLVRRLRVSQSATRPSSTRLLDAIESLSNDGLGGVAARFPDQFVLHGRGLSNLVAI